MNLFDSLLMATNNVSKKKPKETLLDLARLKFSGDTALIDEIANYLKSRRQQRNYPSRVSWIAQLELLEKVPPSKRARQVHISTLRGYRQIAFVEEASVKASKNNICEEGF